MGHFGPGFEATLWQNRESQTLRFDVALGLINVTGTRVADLGCGTGDLVGHMQNREIRPSAYLGIDAQPEMIELAGKNHDDPTLTFLTLDIVSDHVTLNSWKPDVCIISGTLNTMPEKMAWRMVAASYESARIGVVFNFLSNRHHERFRQRDLRPARRFNTVRWLERCMRLSSRVAFRQDYLDGHDATIAILKEN